MPAGKSRSVDIYLRAHDQATRQLRQVDENTRRLADSAKALGRSFMIAGAAITGALGATVKVAGEFEKQMAFVNTMLGESSEHYLPQFEKAVREMSRKFGEGTDVLSRGLYDILSAGVEASGALNVLEVATKAAKAGMTDTAIAADALTTMLNSYGLSAKDAMRVSDVLFGIVTKGKTTFAELAPVIGRVAALASSAGVSMEEMGGALAVMTRGGLRTEEAITGLRAIITAYMSPVKQAAELSATLGIEISAAALRSKGLAGVMAELATVNQDLLGQVMPNVRALAGLSVALQGAGGITEDTEFMMKSAGLTMKNYEKITKTFSHAWDVFKMTALDVARAVGLQLLPEMTKFMGMASRALEVFDKIPKPLKKLVVVMTALAGATLLAYGAWARFILPMILLKTLNPALAGFGAILTTSVVPALKGFALAMWGLLKPILVVIGAVETLNRSIAAAGWVTGKQYELLGKFFKKPGWEGFGKGLQKEMKDIMTAKPLEWLTEGFNKLIGEVNAAELDTGEFGKQLQTQYDQMLKNAKATMQFGDALGQLDNKLEAEQIGLGKFIPAMLEMGKGLKGIFEVGELIPPTDADHRRPVQIQVVVYADDSKTVGKLLESELDKAGAFA